MQSNQLSITWSASAVGIALAKATTTTDATQVVINAVTKQVVDSLVRYWCDNPQACDTAEGIRRWWLMQIDTVSIEQVNRVLAWLCECGAIERLLAADGRVRFRRVSRCDDAALRRLAASDGPDAVRSSETN